MRQGCQEYDKGAKWFEDPARLGTPSSSSGVQRMPDDLSRYIAVGFRDRIPYVLDLLVGVTRTIHADHLRRQILTR